MPSYGLHIKMAEVAFKPMQKYIDLDQRYVMLNAIGPDAYMVTFPELFNRQHVEKVGDYFVCLMDEIKANNLLENPNAIAYLYGAICHYALDITTHPLIYYMTEINDYGSRIWDLHGLLELWLDDYFRALYHDGNKCVFEKIWVKDKATNNLINDVYKKVYDYDKAALKYNLGLGLLALFEEGARQNKAHVAPIFDKLVARGNFYNNGDIYRAIPYLNLEHNVVHDPVTVKRFNDSFMDLWYKSLTHALELIEMANNYLYKDIPINYDAFNNSYNTGHIWTEGSVIKVYRNKPISGVK